MTPYTSVPCQRCGAAAWVATSTGIGQCQQCQTPIQLTQAYANPGYTPQGPPAFGGQTPQAAPTRSRSRLGLKVVVVLLGVTAIVCGLVFMGYRKTLNGMGIDVHAADPTSIIRTAGGFAHEWRDDATFQAIYIQGMRANGTVDLSKPNSFVYVEYVSPSVYGSESIKRFTFTSEGVRDEYRDRAGYRAVPPPVCTAQRLGAAIVTRGATPTEEFTASYSVDPSSPGNTDARWTVMSGVVGGGGENWGNFDANTCAPLSTR